MDNSVFLGKTMGLYLIIVSLAMLVNMPQFISLIGSVLQDKPLMFVSSFFTLIVGLLLIVSHNRWQWHWRVIITLIAWLILLKAITLLFYPQFIDQLTNLFMQNTHVAYVSATIDLVLGLILCYFGFTSE